MKKHILAILFFISLPLHAEIIWHDCGDAPFHIHDAADGQQCAQLTVPLSYHHDHHSARRNETRTITLALSRLPAIRQKQGSVIFISGGPGQAGVAGLEEADNLDELREHYDLIVYDPRGVGRSTPRIACLAEGEELPEDAQTFVQGCRQHTPAYFLPHIGSDEATNDLEQIRRALGETQLNLAAYSYGTKIAALYALRFPEQVRAVILDGVVDIFEDPYAMQINQQKAFQHTFEHYLAQCRQTPLCPFAGKTQGSDTFLPLLKQNAWLRLRESQAQQQWQQQWKNTLHSGGNILASALQGALTGDFSAIHTANNPPASELPDPETILTLLQNYLLWEELWPDIDYTLRRYMMGDTFPLYIHELMEEDIAEALLAINCADMARPMSHGENRILQRHLQHASPYDNLLHDADDRQYLDPCGFWPHIGGDHRQNLPAQAPSELPVLVMAQRHDPATPWHNARRMADYFQSPLITLEGYGHTQLFNGVNSCMDDIAYHFIRNPGQAPHDQSCTREPNNTPPDYYPRPPAWY